MFSKLFVTSVIVFNLLLSINSMADPIRLSEPVAFDDKSETFGKVFDGNGEALELASVIKQPDLYLGKEVVIRTSIAKVCQKKGCFFIAQQDEHTLRVAFKDYGFFIPTDSGGKSVLLAGELVKKELTEDQAAHFNADLNTGSEALNAGEVYEIVASGISIPHN